MITCCLQLDAIVEYSEAHGNISKIENTFVPSFPQKQMFVGVKKPQGVSYAKFMSTMIFADHEKVPKFFLKKFTRVPSYSSCYFKSRPFSNCFFFWLIKSIFKLLIQLSREFFYFTLSILLNPCLICLGYLLLWVYII